VIPQSSLLIFDTGANSIDNKTRIKNLDYNYLTLKAKKVGTYKKYIQYFMENLKNGNTKHFEMNERHYSCVKKKQGDETLYIFFSSFMKTQIKNKEKKFERQKKKGNTLLEKKKVQKIPSDLGWVEHIPHLQKTISAIEYVYKDFSFLSVLLMKSLRR
jgi:hypothetical protein